MPSTAATMPKPGRASAIFVQRVHRRMMLFFHHLEFRLQQLGDLFRLDRRIDQRPHAAADEMQQVMVVRDLRVLAEDAALFRIRNVRLERQHAVAAGQPQQIVQALERFFVGRLVVGRAFDGLR